ncbi:hypothetical protein TWF694_008573 [Orbilia ellipsospora]|uniref:Uncharacterized protein n=1 Tax=Orbilia ellipsospora TaxID=2528407 RepID=A0AAV9XI23_9PEZI
MSLFSPPSSPSAPTALDLPTYNLRKRKADIQPTVESPLTKRFRKLNLRNTPASRVTKRTSSPARNSLFYSSPNNSNTTLAINTNTSNTANAQWSLTPPPFQRPSSPPPAVMEVDDTPYKIYINDLDSSSDESDLDSTHKKGNNSNNPIIFLSDVEREMSRIPMAVLKASSSSSSTTPALSSEYGRKLPTARSGTGNSTDLILYRPPEKIVDDGGVSKLILQAKERIRARNISGAMDITGGSGAVVPISGDMMVDQGLGQLGRGFTDSPMCFLPMVEPNNDPDAMVLDDL